MLCLSQFVGETITVTCGGEQLVITVNRVEDWSRGRHRVKLGFTGPQSFQIVRDNAKDKGEVEPDEPTDLEPTL